jgi:hypothetical protein
MIIMQMRETKSIQTLMLCVGLLLHSLTPGNAAPDINGIISPGEVLSQTQISEIIADTSLSILPTRLPEDYYYVREASGKISISSKEWPDSTKFLEFYGNSLTNFAFICFFICSV